jgi:hypothetical protein
MSERPFVKDELVFYSEPLFQMLIFPLSFLLLSLIWIAMFIGAGWFGKSILIVLLILAIRFALNRFIWKVKFLENEIHVLKLHRKIVLKYEQIAGLREHREILLYDLIFIIPKQRIHPKKVYFYCPYRKRVDLNQFLLERNLTVLPEK